MATIKIKLRITSDSKEGKLVFQVIHRRIVRRIGSGISIPEKNWDRERELIIHADTSEIKAYQTLLEKQKGLLRNIITKLNGKGAEYTTDDVIKMFEDARVCPTFVEIASVEIQKKRDDGKIRTAEAYQSAVNQLLLFAGVGDLKIEDINTDFVERFQCWLVAKECANNTISFYMRNLRCLFNRAVRRGYVADNRPFANAFTGVAKTRKRAICESDLKKIKNLDLSKKPGLEESRDLFMLSFYCLGVSFVDLILLKKSNLADGRITYSRAKTGQTISIAVNDKISAILKKYAADEVSPYLLRFIDHNLGNERGQYKNAICRMNRHLKVVGELAGLKTLLTSYVSRHTWASLAKLKNVALSTISDALGHENSSTTQIYLATLDTSHVDKANDLILNGL